jgi:hypothetical protein
MVATAGVEKQSRQATGIPGPDFSHRLEGVQFCVSATHLGEPSQKTVGVLGLDILHKLLEA